MEKDKLTLSAIFIATYTTLLFAIPKALPLNHDSSTIISIIYGVFVTFGLIIDLIFFLYVVFYALEMSSSTQKELPLFDIELNQQQIGKIKNRLFNSGVNLIFLSLTIPFTSVIIVFQKHFNWLWSTIIYVAYFIIISIIINLILRRICSHK